MSCSVELAETYNLNAVNPGAEIPRNVPKYFLSSFLSSLKSASISTVFDAAFYFPHSAFYERPKLFLGIL